MGKQQSPRSATKSPLPSMPEPAARTTRNGRSSATHALLFLGRTTLRDGVNTLVGASKHLPEFTLVSARHAETSLSIVLDNFGVDAGRKWSSLHGYERRPIG